MVEAMYEQSPDYFKQFRKNYKFFILNHEPNFSGFASKANFAVSSHSNKLDFCNHSIDNEKHELSGPLMEKLKIAVNYNSINNLDVSGVPVRRRLPQVCFGSQTKSVQTQTDLITNVTIERFTNILNGENAAEFSKIIDIILSGYGCMEIDSNTLFVKFIMEKKFKF